MASPEVYFWQSHLTRHSFSRHSPSCLPCWLHRERGSVRISARFLPLSSLSETQLSLQISASHLWTPKNLKQAIDAARVALWSWDVDDDRFAMDDRAFDLWGLPWAKEVAFEDLAAHIHPADRDRVRAAFKGTPSVTGSYEIDFRIMLIDEVR